MTERNGVRPYLFGHVREKSVSHLSCRFFEGHSMFSSECEHVHVLNRAVNAELGAGLGYELGVGSRVLPAKPMIEVRDVQC